MRNFKLLLLVLFVSADLHAQDDSLKILLYQGVALHDQGDYDGAIKLYDEVISKDPSRLLAWYEKSLSLCATKKYQECADLCKLVLKNFKEGDELDNIYVNYGTALDALGKPDEAIRIYSQGIKKYNHYLLFFNRGITEYQEKDHEAGIDDFQQTLMLKPLHASSHQFLGYAMYDRNKVASILSLSVFLMIEPNTARSEKNLKLLNALYSGFAKKGEDKTVTIFMDRNMPDVKKKKPDDFSLTEFSLKLQVALEYSDSLKGLNPAEHMKGRLETLSAIGTDKKGFFTGFYGPFFKTLKEAGWLETAAYVIYAGSGDEDVKKWITGNEEKITGFMKWLKEYKWAGKEGRE